MRTSHILDKNEIESIIKECDVCFLGLVDFDGAPYVIPMSFGYDGKNIVLHSGPHGKHINLIEKDNRACITFCSERALKNQDPNVACSYSQTSKSVVCKGRIHFVEDLDLKEKHLNTLMYQYTKKEFKYSLPSLKNVKVWLLEIEEITAKSFGQNFKK